MDEQRDWSQRDPDELAEMPRVGFATQGDESDDRVHLETHSRQQPRDPAHVDLTKEEYTPDEVARMIGTSRDVVLHAIRSGELKADRKGQDVVCITHADVTDWLRRRGPGV
jgi:excisionase family DNA binding protein